MTTIGMMEWHKAGATKTVEFTHNPRSTAPWAMHTSTIDADGIAHYDAADWTSKGKAREAWSSLCERFRADGWTRTA